MTDPQAAVRPTLTIGVLAKNEAHQIERCLRSAAFADQVVVVDSGSSDDTVAIAEKMGAQVHLYPDWQGFAVQRNRLLAHATGDYLFFLDADEEITPALQVRHPGGCAFRVSARCGKSNGAWWLTARS